jgi:hypothetical protein
MRGWKKRMPSCNELDSGSKFASGENCADFHLVLFCKKSIVRLFNQESKCNPLTDCAPGSQLGQVIISMYCKGNLFCKLPGGLIRL